MKKNIMIFCGGAMFSVVICIFIGFYNIRKDQGLPLVGAKVYGDIRITRQKASSEMITTGIDSLIVIERNGEAMMLLNFDVNNKLKNAVYMLGDGVSFSSSIKNGIHQTCSYGNYEESVYIDRNCDGKFDNWSNLSDRFIFVKNSLIHTDELNGDTAKIYGDDTERKFILTLKDGWTEVLKR